MNAKTKTPLKKHLVLPTWIKIWLIVSSFIVFWDVMFVLLRPASLPEGSLSFLWIPYAKYIKIDKSYSEMNDSFIVAQAIMSLFEISIGMIALYLNYLKKNAAAILLALYAMLLTSTKTILIFIREIVGGLKHVGHNAIADLIFFYILPNAMWIIIPLPAVFRLGSYLISRLEQDHRESDLNR